jgi:hypothetical protein
MVRKTITKTKKRRTNPNGVNQYTQPDPRQALFLSYFMDPTSETFANCLQSGIRAGFSQQYAESLTGTMPKWLHESLESNEYTDMLTQAKRNMREILSLDHVVDAMGPFGPLINKKTKKPFKRISTSILKIKADATEFALESLDKKNFGKQTKIGIAVQFNNVHTDKERFRQ